MTGCAGALHLRRRARPGQPSRRPPRRPCPRCGSRTSGSAGLRRVGAPRPARGRRGHRDWRTGPARRAAVSRRRARGPRRTARAPRRPSRRSRAPPRCHQPAAPAAAAPASPLRTQAAWRAAPRATYSPSSGTSTGRPKTAGASARTAGDFAAPPMSRTRCIGTPLARSASRASAMPQSIPRTAARARCAASWWRGSVPPACRWRRAGWGCARRRGRGPAAARRRRPGPRGPGR